jgi:biotin carboxyl carrier protein
MYKVSIQGKTFEIDEKEISDNNSLNISEISHHFYQVAVHGKNHTVIVDKIDTQQKEITLKINGEKKVLQIEEPIDVLLKNMGLDLKAMQKVEPIKAPMPGMVLKILVEPGQQIEKGQGVLILEAMKMENVLKSSAAATVKSIKVSEKSAVEKGAILVELV